MEAKSQKGFSRFLGPISRAAKVWHSFQRNAEFRSWQKQNPDKQFKDFFAETTRAKLRRGQVHATLGPNLRAKSFGESGKRGFEELLSYGLQKGHVCVDYGCGTLRLGVHVINYLRPGNYWGLDIDDYLLEEGRKLLGEKLLSKKGPHLQLISPESIAMLAGLKPDLLVAAKVLIHVHPQELDDFFGNILTIIDLGRAIVSGKWSDKETIQLSDRSWAHSLPLMLPLASKLGAKLTILREEAWHPTTHSGLVRKGVFSLARNGADDSVVAHATGN